LIPPGIALLVNVFYYLRRPGLDGYVAAFALAAVAFLFVVSLERRRREWRTAGSRVPSNASGQITQVGLLLAFVLVSLAWGVPSFARSDRAADLWTSVTQPWVRLRYRLTQAFTGLRNPVAVVSDVFGDQLRLAAAVTRRDADLHRHAAQRLPDGRASTGAPDLRYYDLHVDHGRDRFEPYFLTKAHLCLTTQAGGPSKSGVDPHVEALHLLYAPSQPSGINRSSLLTVVRTPGGLADVSSVAARTTVVRGEVYRVHGEVAVPTAAQLRSAGTDYPAWVLSRFLVLPETLTPRTRQLAIEITRGLDNPYDQAVAITRWLRTNIRYSLESGEPPEGAEPIDWFLFDPAGLHWWPARSAMPPLGIRHVAAGFAQDGRRAGPCLVRSARTPARVFPGL
jgi:hypothetical protein